MAEKLIPVVFQRQLYSYILNKLFVKHIPDSATTQKKEITISLEYLEKISLLAVKQLTNNFRSFKLNVIVKTSNRLRNTFRFENQFPNVSIQKLCKYKCDICKYVYNGKAIRRLIVRQYEHLGKSIPTGKPLRYSDKDATAISKHCRNLDHLASIDNFSILGNAMNNYYLSLKESPLVSKLKPSLNVTKESIPLYLFDNDSEHC